MITLATPPSTPVASLPPARLADDVNAASRKAATHPGTDESGTLAPAGHVSELAGRAGAGAVRTVAVAAAREAQAAGDPVAWVGAREALPHTPDLAAAGLDLEAFVAVAHGTGDAAGRLRSAELLLRSGGFGLVVVDLSDVARVPGAAAALARLRGVAQRHRAHALLLVDAEADAPSLGAPVSRRLAPRRGPMSADGTMALELRPSKDRLRQPLALRAALPEGLEERHPGELAGAGAAAGSWAEVLPFSRGTGPTPVREAQA